MESFKVFRINLFNQLSGSIVKIVHGHGFAVGRLVDVHLRQGQVQSVLSHQTIELLVQIFKAQHVIHHPAVTVVDESSLRNEVPLPDAVSLLAPGIGMIHKGQPALESFRQNLVHVGDRADPDFAPAVHVFHAVKVLAQRPFVRVADDGEQTGVVERIVAGRQAVKKVGWPVPGVALFGRQDGRELFPPVNLGEERFGAINRVVGVDARYFAAAELAAKQKKKRKRKQ